MFIIDCAYPGCAFQSEDAPEAVACTNLQSHAFSHAVPGPNFSRAPSEEPKLTRPSIDIGLFLERGMYSFAAGKCLGKDQASTKLQPPRNSFSVPVRA